jgi:thiamine-phosphate pyrophosphorylase
MNSTVFTKGPRNRLLFITPSSLSEVQLLQIIEEAIKGGLKIIQLREKELSRREFLRRAEVIRAITQKARVQLLINDSVEIAKAVDAEGVHIGKDDFPIEVARRVLGKKKIIGRTCRSLSEVKEAVAQGASYVSLGPIFHSPTKPNITQVLSPWVLSEVKQVYQGPLVAVGGITLSNLRECFLAGATGVAVCSDIWKSEDIRGRVQEYIRKIKNCLRE